MGNIDNPVVIHNLIDQEDRDIMIDFLKNEEEKFKHAKDGRFVMDNGSDQRIVNFAKKYTARLRERYPEFNSLYPHITYFFKYTTEIPLYMHSDAFWDSCDSDPYVVVFYFNDDFEGSELIIPSINYEYTPVAGEAVMFDLNLIHGTTPMTKGIKYIINICFTPHLDRVLPQYMECI